MPRGSFNDNEKYQISPLLYFIVSPRLPARIDDRGSKPFLEFLASVGEFPTLAEDWNETQADFSLEKTIINMAKLGQCEVGQISINSVSSSTSPTLVLTPVAPHHASSLPSHYSFSLPYKNN